MLDADSMVCLGETPIRKDQGALKKKKKKKKTHDVDWFGCDLSFYLTPKTYLLKHNKLDYQLVFRRAAYNASRPDFRRAAKIEPKNGIRAFLL